VPARVQARCGARRAVVALIVVAIAACSDDDDTAVPTTAQPTTTTSAPAPPVFEETPCDPVPSDPARVRCGYLDVPLRHDGDDGSTVRMAVAIVEPVDGDPAAAPLVFLAGGPGFGGTGSIEPFLENPPAPRTIVLPDYRGVGRSEPFLGCAEFDALGVDTLGLDGDDPDVLARFDAALVACRDRLVGEGIDLSAFNYTEIAADLADLRVALGIDEWDLYGLSNGGRVALEVARRHPEGIRSLVLDAASPPQGNLPGELWPHAQRAFDALFDACAADAACAGRFGDLGSTYASLLEQLRAAPVDVAVPSPDGAPITVRFTDELGVNALRNALYETALIPLLPFYIDELAHGRAFDQVAQLVVERSAPGGDFSAGMALSVNCQEEVAFLPPGFFEQQATQYPLLAPAISLDRNVHDCELWDVGQADASIDEPVTSDIPALVLVGELDPVHPRSSAESIASGLSRSTLVELPGLGHGTINVHACPTSLVAPFLDDPTAPVDTGCVAELAPPAWLLG